ncbi:hypothetical protein FoTM2_011613 [Fusarium oxysporum f. sp. vasinfectum]|nr:hypothetical protein FoTM2_011613 [Fusarium oxysporum f. sp. vasinfectum]
MKSVVASIGMLAAVANAYNFPHHAHYRRDNGTDTQTTLTVKTTVVETITSCAPTVTNCPARDHTAIAQLPESDKVTYVETNTVILTEVVCPVADASSIYTSVLHDAETGGVTGKTLTAPYTASVPMTTGGAYPPPKEGDKTVVSDYTTEQCVPETVTVTAPASTVYVTVVPEASKTGSSDDATVTDKAATVTVVPYPVNNTATGGYAKPTGFSRRLR